jgi:hypothetical protein
MCASTNYAQGGDPKAIWEALNRLERGETLTSDQKAELDKTLTLLRCESWQDLRARLDYWVNRLAKNGYNLETAGLTEEAWETTND